MKPLPVIIIVSLVAIAAEGPQPLYVNPGEPGQPPADSVVLFNGSDLSKWRNRDGESTGCKVEDRVMVCRSGDGNAYSTETFRDAQIHLEFMEFAVFIHIVKGP